MRDNQRQATRRYGTFSATYTTKSSSRTAPIEGPDLQYLTWMHPILGGAFMLFAAMVVIDFLHWSKTLEDSLKVVAGTLIFVGFLAARLELREPRRHSPTPEEARLTAPSPRVE